MNSSPKLWLARKYNLAMIDTIEAIAGFLISTVILKGIIAHAIADYIVKYVKKWLDRVPERRAHYEAILHYHRTKAVQ